MGVVRLRGTSVHPICLDTPLHLGTATYLYAPCSHIHLYISRGYFHMIWGCVGIETSCIECLEDDMLELSIYT